MQRLRRIVSTLAEPELEKASARTFRIMTFNVQFYAQMCRALAELPNLEIKYGPFKHKGLVQSVDGMTLSEMTESLPPYEDGEAGFLYPNLPCVRGCHEAIEAFIANLMPDVVAIQEGVKGMDLEVKREGYTLETVVTADAEHHFATKGVLVNQVLLNRASDLVAMSDSWSLVTKQGGQGGLPAYTDDERGDRDVPRAAAGLRASVAGSPVDVVSIHLTGGRFDDRRWKQYKEQRFKEIKAVIDSKYDPDVPMVILGDFNAPSTAAEVSESYGRSLGATTEEDLEIFKEYMVGVHLALVRIGWTPVYSKDDLARPTSVFGGSVDWAYVSPNWPSRFKVGKPLVPDVIHASTEAWAAYHNSSLRLSLSDHNPVVLDITVD